MSPHITLEQWRSLIEVVDAGGYAQAAEKLCKSQSAVSYAVQKIESLLDIKAFEVQGRKAILTPTGHMLYRRALALVNEAKDLERAVHKLSAGWEAVITIAAEILFPSERLLTCLDRFGQESPGTRIELIESVLGGTSDALLSGNVDLAISPQLPPGFLGNVLMRIRLLAVAHSGHPLHHYGRELSYSDLRAHRHVVIRDSGSKRDQRAVSVEVDQRWIVSQVATSIQAVAMGYGFAWLPEESIREELSAGILKPLPLKTGHTREVPLYLILANPDFAGPGVRRLAEILTESVIQ
ncbi:MAG: LysR family transcriptional regulator [Methylicorpusculum sp.]|uniref:LysR family transcriptional regulator n=1 Tax=Methylicorpusculum sp. TaxID=2713644 RepID=UPI00271EC78D|nr:LysR family transcriptional regulator [Methylicorpusculum sp.]MDO8940937.1 LysR family transcriptional regulator [Methylicorpusculum sp.]MDO9241098.1 LysR family transcriptional regulator [Methylicorpusculum sp.]MDP2202828.1 LysR family transcriptional regulator [Methylicorpusculum sp.]